MKDAETSSPALPSNAASSSPLSPDEVRQCTRVLEAIADNRVLLAKIPEEEKLALLMAASRVVYPDRVSKKRMDKALRRERREEKQAKDRVVIASTRIRTMRQAPVFTVPLLPAPPPVEAPERELEKPRKCYVCKVEYKRLHFFYDSMCVECADFNYAKRIQRAPLEGKVALITGARVKIGFQASLMLLRSGATVIATTRFPQDSARRYLQEPDFADWSHRLHIHGLDLRHAPSVEIFAKYVEQTHSRLDILINNAAQTVRRPPGFYAHLLDGELRQFHELPEAARPLLAGHRACIAAVNPLLGSGEVETSSLTTTWRSSDPALGIHSSAALSLLPYALESEGDTSKLFPVGRLDADEQQVDLRDMNSWRMKLADVSTAEMLEVHLVNAVAPFILCGKLKPLMMKDRTTPGHIVNVSAMEGSFSRGTKTDRHPHTNMAKAALNMMTLTSAADYAKDRIYMNAVDTGWVTDEDPALFSERKVKDLDFQPPLDIVDGAARVVDPVMTSENSGHFSWGNFFKDYRHTSW